jgi:hypothetical protein
MRHDNVLIVVIVAVVGLGPLFIAYENGVNVLIS